MKQRLALAGASVVALLLGGALTTAFVFPHSQPGYILNAARFQAELLWGRVPVEKALQTMTLTEEEREKLLLVAPIKQFGRDVVGLENTENYDTIHPTWDRTIWNVSACDPLAFRPVRRWFPIVGSVPYLGFFEREAADAQVQLWQKEGHDTYIRTAGAYSTLGWFRDPILPKMLKWSEYRLSETILHELTHATLWVPGSVKFNESFANFVGEVAAHRYLAHTYGEDSPELAYARQVDADHARYKHLLHGVYQELDAVYRDESLADSEKLEKKSFILDSLPRRAQGAAFHRAEHYAKIFGQKTWNNARLMQFKTYNDTQDAFQRLLDQHDQDLLAFIEAVETITAGAADPEAAIREHVGMKPRR